MKKAITILAMIAIVAFAVFADAPVGETQRITIKSVVERVDPQYQLKGVLGANAANFTTVADVIAAGDVATPHNGEELEGGDISQDDIVASFGLFQIEDAKNRFAYSFGITATSLVQVKDAQGNAVAQQNAYTTAHAPVFSALAGDWYNAQTDGISAASKSLDPSTGVTANVTFDGLAKINKSTTTPKLTFTVTWDDDAEAPAGTYMADVTMAYTVQ